MRSLLARIAIASTFGIAIAGCGTQNGTSLPVGAVPNGSGGGPPNVSNQAPPPGTVSGAAIVGAYSAANAFTGYDNTATDATNANDYGTDAQPTYADQPVTSGTPPSAPGSSHLITFSGNNTPVVNFRYTGPVTALTIPATTPGQIVAQTYGAIILHAPETLTKIGTLSPNSLFVELIGGAGGTAYDVRAKCTIQAPPITAPPTPTVVISGLVRYICPLPAYGSPSSTGQQNLVRPNASGTFTPTVPPIFYVGETFGGSSTPPTEISTLNVDYIYAQQGLL
jgi:hypothetical protein